LVLKTLLPKDDRYGAALKLVNVRGTARTAVARKAIVVVVLAQMGKKKSGTAGPEPAGDVSDYQEGKSGEGCCYSVVNAARASSVDVEAGSSR
jgi:hypothetical protein